MKDRTDGYIANGGWSSKLFAAEAIKFMGELKALGYEITVGRSVIWIGGICKAYVHHNGRSEEFATITNVNGKELGSFHYTEFDKLRACVLERLGETK